MKIIHVSDLHIDSKMQTNFNPIIARQRNNEILVTFEKLFDLMEKENYSAMIISGDMFDTQKVTSKAFSYIMELIKKHNNKTFFYVPGNHDKECDLINAYQALPSNLILFNDHFSKTMLTNKICVGGKQLTNINCSTFGDEIEFDENNINIMVMHGAITKVSTMLSNSSFHPSCITNKNIDYVALGHIHEYNTGKIDKRCIYVYPGCLEPRGFDEIGNKGFVKIEIDETNNTITHEFIKFSYRTFHEINIDISNISSSRAILDHIYNFKIPSSNILKVVLTGYFNTSLNKNLNLLEEELLSKYYFAKIIDKSKLEINPNDYEGDISLKGCFIRKVMESKLSDSEKADVIMTGLKALKGEDLE